MTERSELTRWVREYTGELLSWARHRTSDLHTAEDLVQETFLAAAESLASFRGDSAPKTWLFGILNNKIASYHASRARRPDAHSVAFADDLFDERGHWKADTAPADWGSDETNPLDDEEFLRVLQRCLEQLPPLWHSCLTMKYLSDRETATLCQELGISVTNYWQLTHRAKLQVRRCIELRWFNE
ncbi:MAG: sigma-70 family RNA polymerase sigma factor [Bacteroidetes bacterium]|nr:MAG: sigma-70 family RNA polymerase sigma factor [Bacteroidota bacterium]